MTIRVVARIRPVQHNESQKDIIVQATGPDDGIPKMIKIPNPKKQNEDFTFQFSGVYGEDTQQQTIYDNEVAPTVKHLFNGFDVTIFAYGSTGTGKTHTMRGGKTLGERGVIPRLLSSIYRKSRKLDKDSGGQTKADIALSYYEIYNDKVYDLLEAPERRTMAGLPLRDSNGKTMVCGLTERRCESLKEFERLYDEANINRSTSATKLNAHSSRSHAVLRINVAVTTGEETRISTVSAIDLAGSEDNRRTENGKERLVESASINRSLFVLAKCVEAISQKQRAPYRESKMTRILSLGQNNGMTVMILNLAPVRSFHLDTLSSLNFANRTKKIEIREVENEPVFKGCTRPTVTGPSIQRQPLRALAASMHNSSLHSQNAISGSKRAKASFAVYTDQRLSGIGARAKHANSEIRKQPSPLKRASSSGSFSHSRPTKRQSPNRTARPQPVISKESLDELIERKVSDVLAARALDHPSIAPVPDISEEVQKRLDLLEQKIEGRDDGREQGLTFLLMAKQHAVRGEDASALRMFILAKDYFPDNAKLDQKIQRLQTRLEQKRQQYNPAVRENHDDRHLSKNPIPKISQQLSEDDEYQDAHEAPSDEDYNTAGSFRYRAKQKAKSRRKRGKTELQTSLGSEEIDTISTPRTKQLLHIVNTRDLAQIRLLRGVGAKKAEAIREALCADEEDELQGGTVHSLTELSRLKGVGTKAVENMRKGLGEVE